MNNSTNKANSRNPSMLVFCGGIGLVSYAARKVGYDVKGCIDFADIPALSYQQNFPEVKFLKESLRKVNAKFLCKHFGLQPKELDVLQISTPCTGWSTTGTFEPTHADNELFFIAAYLALQMQPRVILFENVKGMTWKKMQIAFAMLSHFFKKLESLYNIDALIMDSNAHGDAQSRERLFIICVRKDVGKPRWPMAVRDTKTIGDVLPYIDYMVSSNFGDRVYEKNEPAPTITAHANIVVGTDRGERKIKPRELARLFGLQDDFILVGNEAEQIKGIGNGVPVGVMTALLETIKYDILGFDRPEGLMLRSIPTELVDCKGYVLYHGKSNINGDQIVAIITTESVNEKTGNMAQLWILNANDSPVAASKNGTDESVCGSCSLRHHNKGACYVNLSKAPLKVWRSWQSRIYPFIKQEDYHLFKDIPIRVGVYGDPYAIPFHILEALKTQASNTTSYTHQWVQQDADPLKGLCMASVESEEQYRTATEKGWRSFRIIRPEDSLMEDEILCPNLTNGVQCRDCNLCTGTSLKAKNIAIYVHGKKMKKFKANTPSPEGSHGGTISGVSEALPTPYSPTTVNPLSKGEAVVSHSTLQKVQAPKIINSEELLGIEFTALNFQGRWRDFFGLPSVNFNCIIHGLPGHGKSTFAVQFAKYLADNFGKVVYISGEEGFNSTFKAKFVNNHAMSSCIDVADLRSFDEIVTEIPPNSYNFIVIDSLNTLHIGAAQVRELRERHNNSSLICIAQATKAGQLRGSLEIVHDADVAVKVSDGTAVTEKNRFKEKDMSFDVF